MDKVKIVKIFLQYNYNVSEETLEFIQKKNVSERELKEFLITQPQLEPVISVNLLRRYLENLRTEPKHISLSEDSEEQIKTEIKTLQQKTQERKYTKLRFSIDLDIPYKLSEEPKLTVFRNLFLDRYQTLSKILLQNLEPNTTILTHNLPQEEVPISRSGMLVGMIQDTQVLHTNRFVIQLEDFLTGRTTKCVIVKDTPSFPQYRRILRDSVIGVAGVLPKNFLEGELTAFWGQDILRPSFKNHKFSTSEPSTKVLCLSDIHCGSSHFSNRLFSRLVAYLNEEVSIPDIPFSPAEISSIIIAGDLVEGTGLVTKEENELKIDSYEGQYNKLSELLRKIPDRITIFTIPGEHDATHLAIPQPAIDKKMGKSIYSFPNIKNHGNPLRITINGMRFLIFHAQSCNNLFYGLMKINQTSPIQGFKELMEYRHLSPEFGSFAAYAPYSRDYLVIDEVPDILVTGHFHQARKGIYRGVSIATCGTFKKMTKTDKKTEREVSVGVFPIVDTKTAEITMLDLNKIP